MKARFEYVRDWQVEESIEAQERGISKPAGDFARLPEPDRSEFYAMKIANHPDVNVTLAEALAGDAGVLA